MMPPELATIIGATIAVVVVWRLVARVGNPPDDPPILW
jgi:hypothetical protein